MTPGRLSLAKHKRPGVVIFPACDPGSSLLTTQPGVVFLRDCFVAVFASGANVFPHDPGSFFRCWWNCRLVAFTSGASAFKVRALLLRSSRQRAALFARHFPYDPAPPITSVPGTFVIHVISLVPGTTDIHVITLVPGTTVLHVITVVPGTTVIYGITVVPGTLVIGGVS